MSRSRPSQAGEVYCRYDESDPRRGRVHRPVPPATTARGGDDGERLAGRAAAHDRRRRRRLCQTGVAVMPVVRLLPPGQEVGAARADQRAASWLTSLQTAGADRVITVDLHAGQVRGSSRSRSTIRRLCSCLRSYFVQFADRHRDRLPGRRSREAEPQVRRACGCRSCAHDEGPSSQQVAEIGYVIGDVEGKTAVIVDDIIDSAGHAEGRGARQCSTRARRASTRWARTGSSPGRPTRTSPRCVRADRRHRHGSAASRCA